MELAGKNVVVVGLARSGIAAALFLARQGAHVVATDLKRENELEAAVLSLSREGVRLELGSHSEKAFLSADLVVVSPGVPWDLAVLEAARGKGTSVLGELELASRLMPGPIAAVTGTKGKSTTTAALGAFLSAGGASVRVGGNIGTPATSILEGATEETIFVLETSSFQLEGTSTFHPKVAVFLNLTPDHLDRHETFGAYLKAKTRIFSNQEKGDFAVVNRETLDSLPKISAQVVPFSDDPGKGDGAFFTGDKAVLSLDGKLETLFSRSDLQVMGSHLASDLLAAATAARLLGAPLDAIARGAGSFRGLEHVLEPVAEIRGVRFVNDSKATNVDATVRSLEAFAPGVLPILGGRFKGGDLSLLREPLKRRARVVLTIGEAAPKIAQALEGVVPTIPCSSLEEAVETGFEKARSGEVVLLAPACASFDMFRDYAERGRAFKAAVLKLKEKKG